MTSMDEVAAKAAVSKTTVSRVLNGSAVVGEDTRKRVLEACRSLNYRLNPNIQDLVRRRKNGATRNLAFVLVGNEFSNPAYVRLLDGIAEGAKFHHYHLMLVKMTGQERDLYDLPSLLRDDRVDGILFSGNITANSVSALESLGRPCVVLGNYEAGLLGNFSSVQLNIHNYVSNLVRELTDRNYRRFAFAIEDMELYSNQVIWENFRDVLKQNGLECRQSYFGAGPMAGLFQLLEPVFAQRELPFDAIFCPDFRQAIDVSHLMLRHRACFPEMPEVLLASAGNWEYCRLPVPFFFAPLDSSAMALAGLELLMDSMENPNQRTKMLFV